MRRRTIEEAPLVVGGRGGGGGGDLERFAVASSLSSADGDGGDDGKGSGKSTRTAVVDLLGRYARATTTAAPGGVSVTKYVAKR